MMLSSIGSYFWYIFMMIIGVFLLDINAIEFNSAKTKRSIVPGAYIVEFSPSLTRLHTNNHHEIFYRRLATMDTIVTPYLNFSSPIFIGASFHLNNNDNISAIVALDSVAAIWPVTVYSRPNPTVDSVINLGELMNMIENGTNQNSFGPHVMTGVDKLHDQGYKGANIFIAIIDTGVDYRHPALGGGFGVGYKIQYGYDFVGDNYTGYNLGVPDNDVLDCNGHGTHVSGIIGAESPIFTGVAPNATLGMYKVFGCDGGAANDVIIAAFTAAHADGAHIITASLGSASAWAEDPVSIVVSRIAETGVTCTVATGNDGRDGLFFAASPATGVDVIAVGSVNSITIRQFMYQGEYSTNNSERNSTFQYFPANDPFPANISGYPLYALSYDTNNTVDACTELPSNTTVLSGKIILIRRGICAFITVIENVKNFGAQYVIFYNNENSMINPQSLSGVLVAMVSAEQGIQWIDDLKQGLTINLHFPTNATIIITDLPRNITGGAMSTFSSWSPTNELYAKPEVSAPGGSILSTYLLASGGYAILSGTSMATPYIAGVIALYRNAKGLQMKIDPWTIKQILATTATPLSFNDGSQNYPYLAPVVQQGGGLINAYAAMHYTTLISPSILFLNDTAHFNRIMKFTIKNTDTNNVSYTITHLAAATVYALSVNSSFPENFPPELNTQYATVIISPFALTLPGNSTTIITVTFSHPTDLQTQRIPVFSGYINIESSNNESLHLPYIGVASNMKDVMVTDFEILSPYISNSTDNIGIPESIAANITFNMTTDLPNFNWRLVMGSPLVRLDILGSGNQTQVLGVNILGSVPDFPMRFVPRNYLTNQMNHNNAIWNGTLSTGVQVPTGNYMFLYRALKIFGDPNNSSDYENWTSPIFRIVYDVLQNSSLNITTNNAQIISIYNIKLFFFLIIISYFY